MAPILETPDSLCRLVDVIDMSECRRRLDVGEPFDELCNAQIESRRAIGDGLKAMLGDAHWALFEAHYESLLKGSPDMAKPATCALISMRCHLNSLRVQRRPLTYP